MNRDDFDSHEAYVTALKKEAIRLGYSSVEGLPMYNGKIVPKGKLAFDFSYDALNMTFDRLHEVQNSPGLYQIYTFDGLPLKVGIARQLRSRLSQHCKSSQKRLKPTTSGEITQPSHLESKQSILAKHFFFDNTLTTEYDLKTEIGRQEFLKQETYLLITYTANRDDAKRLDEIAESYDMWRY